MASLARSFRPSRAEIDLTKIAFNYRTLRGLVKPEAFVCPMIKANAYGHGDIEIARALRAEGAKHLGVALIEEAVKLRDAGDGESVLVFTTFDDTASAQAIIDFKLTPVIGSWEQLESLKSVASRGDSRLPIHIEFNTGMNRLGFALTEAARLREFVDQSKALELKGICTHLSRGEDAGISNGDSARQIEGFKKALAAFDGLDFSPHVLNSPGAAAFRGSHIDSGFGFRPGIALYGAQPCSQKELALNLRPVMSLKSQLITLVHVPSGSGVSYDSTWIAKRDSLIGVVPFGYADGYSRRLSNRGSVLCEGTRVPITGIVCMDYMMVDLTELATQHHGVLTGAEVVLLGQQGKEQILVEEIAQLCQTISYEVLTNVGQRVPRKYLRSVPEGVKNV